jgi:hypothetical protein
MGASATMSSSSSNNWESLPSKTVCPPLLNHCLTFLRVLWVVSWEQGLGFLTIALRLFPYQTNSHTISIFFFERTIFLQLHFDLCLQLTMRLNLRFLPRAFRHTNTLEYESAKTKAISEFFESPAYDALIMDKDVKELAKITRRFRVCSTYLF